MMFFQKIAFRSLVFASFWSLFACAKVGSLTGGEKDLTPPAVDSTRSTPNFSTHFQGKKIELTFNEWVKLDNPNQQVLISPPLAKRPEVTLHGHTVRVQLPENDALRENTTYTINFGTAVKDLNESNVAPDLRFVFSTGDRIDSLRLAGDVVDAFSGQPVENASVMLYENLADSAARKERPFYFGKTDKSGHFQIQNLRAGRFKIIALDDQNLDYKFSDGEKMGFLEKPIALPILTDSTTTAGPISIRLFKNKTALKMLGSETKGFGLARLFFNDEPPAGLRPEIKNAPQLIDFERVNDSIYVWYDQPSGPFSLIFEKDTATVKPSAREEFLKKHKLAWSDDLPQKSSRGGSASRGKFNQNQPTVAVAQAVKTTTQNPAQPLDLLFNLPVGSLDSSKIQLTSDSLKTSEKQLYSLKKDSISPRKWLLQTKWRDGQTYHLTILPAAATDFWGEKNSDTLRRTVAVLSAKTLGTIHVSFKNLVVGAAYVFELVSGETVVEHRPFLFDAAGNRLSFVGVPSGQYTGRLIEDLNKNGRWDAGNYDEHRQPEVIFTQKMEPLKANWEQEIEFKTSGSTEASKRIGKKN